MTHEELFKKAKRVIPGGVNSPVRAFRGVGGTPRFMVSGSGPYLTDAAGKVDQLAQRAVVLDQPRGHCFALVRDRAGKHQHLHRVDERRILPDARPAEIQLSGF